MHQKPMLNSPVELQSDAAEEFAKNVIARLEASHEARRALDHLLFKAVHPDVEHIAPDERCFTALNSGLNRKTFGAAG
jgi:hypothetical protein